MSAPILVSEKASLAIYYKRCFGSKQSQNAKAEHTDTGSRIVGRLIAQIPDDDAVPLALHEGNGKQAVEYMPDSEFSIAIKKLANDVIGAYPMQLSSGKTDINGKPKRRKLFGLLPI